MAYPFTPLPRFADFVSEVQSKFNCRYKVDDEGTPFPIQYFERTIEGKTIKCAVYFPNENELLTPSVLRSICRRLDIDVAHFGLHLG